MSKVNLNNPMFDQLDEYEKAFEEGIDESKISFPIKSDPEFMKMARRAAKNTLEKNKRVNIRIPKVDLEYFHKKAKETNIPYQTIMASVLHEYTKGKFTLGL